MQTGQNSIAPESSLPQLGQVRRGSVLMGLTGPSADSNATLHRLTQNRSALALQTLVKFHKQMSVALYYRVKSRFGTKFQPLVPCGIPC
jgi:hypothetical protein